MTTNPWSRARRSSGCSRACTVLVVGLVARAPGAVAHGQEDPPPPTAPPPAEGPAESGTAAPKQAETAESEAPPSLDDLLGIGEDEETQRAQEIAREQAEAELERKLLEQEIDDAFRAAIERMQFAANLLDVEFDPGLGTQRVQEEIVAKLDQLIDAANKSPQSSSSSSSSSSSQSSQSSQSPGQRGEQEGSEGQQEGDQRQDGPASESGEGTPPPGQDAQIGGVLEENRTEWGSLPERIRAMLLQGRQEKFSSMYEELTREYYRRLAEDGS